MVREGGLNIIGFTSTFMFVFHILCHYNTEYAVVNECASLALPCHLIIHGMISVEMLFVPVTPNNKAGDHRNQQSINN